jgi:hypothetical protein
MAIKKSLGLGLVIGLLAMAFAALPAMASAASVTLRSGGAGGPALAEGAGISAFSENLKFATTAGITLECSENTLTGTVGTNPGASVNLTEGAFTGNEGAEECETNVPGLNTIILGVEFLSPMRFFAEAGVGKDEVEVRFTSLLLLPPEFPVCAYEGTVFTEYALGTPLVPPAGDHVVPSTLTLAAGSSAECPGSGVLTGEFEVRSGGGPVTVTSP